MYFVLKNTFGLAKRLLLMSTPYSLLPISYLRFLLLTLALSSVTFAEDWAHFNTADETVLAELERVFSQEPYIKALNAADQLKATAGTALVPSGDSFVPLKYAVALGRNRSLTAQERAIYQSRYESTAAELYRQAIAREDLSARMAALWQVYKQYPAARSAQTALDNLSEYFYQAGQYEPSLRALDELASAPCYDSSALPIEQLNARRLLCLFGKCSLRSGTAFEKEQAALKEQLADFQQRYPNAVGSMGGKKVDLNAFLADAFSRIAPADTSDSAQTSPKSAYRVDAAGLWRTGAGQEPELLAEDGAPDSVKALYNGSFDNAFVLGDGLIFARIGTPNAYENPNRRAPLELGNRLVCVDSRQFNALAWEKSSSNANSRWLVPLHYDSGRLYAVEVQTATAAYELTVVCMDAASGMELFSTRLLSTPHKPTVSFSFESPFTFQLTVEKDADSRAQFEINRTTGEIESLK